MRVITHTILHFLDRLVDEEVKIAALSSIFGNEAGEILKKQLAIEEEVGMVFILSLLCLYINMNIIRRKFQIFHY